MFPKLNTRKPLALEKALITKHFNTLENMNLAQTSVEYAPNVTRERLMQSQKHR